MAGWLEIIRAGPRLMLSMAPALVFVMIAFLNKFANVFTIPKLGWKVPMKPIVFGITAICLVIAVYNITGKGVESAAWVVEGGA